MSIQVGRKERSYPPNSCVSPRAVTERPSFVVIDSIGNVPGRSLAYLRSLEPDRICQANVLNRHSVSQSIYLHVLRLNRLTSTIPSHQQARPLRLLCKCDLDILSFAFNSKYILSCLSSTLLTYSVQYPRGRFIVNRWPKVNLSKETCS